MSEINNDDINFNIKNRLFSIKKSDFKEGHLYAKNQVHIYFAGAVDAADSTGFCFFHILYGRVGESDLCESGFLSCRCWHPERDGIRQIRTEREDHGQPVGDDALPRV